MSTNLAKMKLQNIAIERQRLEDEERQIRADEAKAADEQRQRTIGAALNSVASALQPAKDAFDSAESELFAAVSKIAELARARDAAAEQLKSATRQMRLSLSNAGAPNEQINKATANYESNRRAVVLLSSSISYAKPFSDGILELERRQHWYELNEAQSLVVVITRKAG